MKNDLVRPFGGSARAVVEPEPENRPIATLKIRALAIAATVALGTSTGCALQAAGGGPDRQVEETESTAQPLGLFWSDFCGCYNRGKLALFNDETGLSLQPEVTDEDGQGILSLPDGATVPGRATDLDASPDEIWAVNGWGWIFKHARPVTGAAWQHVLFHTTNLVDPSQELHASAVATGANRDVYVLTNDNEPGANQSIYKYIGNDRWKPIDGAATDIDVDNNGDLWAVSQNGWIFRRKYPVENNVWEGYKDPYTSYQKLSVGSNNVYVVTTNMVANGYQIKSKKALTRIAADWQWESGQIDEIFAGSQNVVWGTNFNGQVFRANGRR